MDFLFRIISIENFPIFYLFILASKNFKKGTIKFLELLDKQGADFSSADGEGQTPLHLATNARNHDGACVKYLIKKINRKFNFFSLTWL